MNLHFFGLGYISRGESSLQNFEGGLLIKGGGEWWLTVSEFFGGALVKRGEVSISGGRYPGIYIYIYIKLKKQKNLLKAYKKWVKPRNTLL